MPASRFEKGERADKILLARGLFKTRAQAQAAIVAGQVKANGVIVKKPSESIALDAQIEAEAAHPWVSRGGLKLVAALDAFGVDPAGRVCLDLGASTGGFTDVLLSRGASRVYAVDVGTGQLAEKLSNDSRVVSLPQLDVRDLDRTLIGQQPSLITADLSFIGLEKALVAALGLCAPKADLIALFKPQFQVGPAHVGKGGLVTDPAAIETAKARFSAWLTGPEDARTGWVIRGWAESPIAGGAGQREALVHASLTPDRVPNSGPDSGG
jgi:23S rRNA (cytidine1920-2'-O)/16S rRNA (cytidine1409-2'-O)-methyltransferase